MTITTLTESTNTKVFFKLALGSTGESNKRYSKSLTKAMFNQIAQSLKNIRVYINIQSDKNSNYKTLEYKWLSVSDISKSDDIQKELFIFANEMYRNNNYQNKDNVNVTIHTEQLPKSLNKLIVWNNDDITNKQTSDEEDIF